MSKVIRKALDWWNNVPEKPLIEEVEIKPVLVNEVDPAPAPMADEAKVVQHTFIQGLMAMERSHASVMTALSNATLKQVRG